LVHPILFRERTYSLGASHSDGWWLSFPLIGRDFGVTTDIETGPNGNLFVVSLTNGAVYEIFQR